MEGMVLAADEMKSVAPRSILSPFSWREGGRPLSPSFRVFRVLIVGTAERLLLKIKSSTRIP
jgi:hypothetical protein